MNIDSNTGLIALLSGVSISLPLLGRTTVLPLFIVGVILFVPLPSKFIATFHSTSRILTKVRRPVSRFISVSSIVGILVIIVEIPLWVYTIAILIYGFGLLGAAAFSKIPSRPASLFGFCSCASTASLIGQFASFNIGNAPLTPLGSVCFMSIVGTLLGGLCYVILLTEDRWLTIPVVTLGLWLLSFTGGNTDLERVLITVGLIVTFGTIAYKVRAASMSGVLAGSLCLTLTAVLGGISWVVILLTFFVSGTLLSQLHALQANGAGSEVSSSRPRSAGNVFANAGASVVLVVLSAASTSVSLVTHQSLLFGFVGGLASATSDTVASEIGERYSDPRLITTFEKVSSGTDGGLTIQGTIAGIGGAALIAAVAAVLVNGLSSYVAIHLAIIGTLGMLLDSVLGATVEGRWMGNNGVNALATISAAGISILLTEAAVF